jgi:hypothetical protein
MPAATQVRRAVSNGDRGLHRGYSGPRGRVRTPSSDTRAVPCTPRAADRGLTGQGAEREVLSGAFSAGALEFALVAE